MPPRPTSPNIWTPSNPDTASETRDLITVAIQGEHGKPRPALVIQSDLFAQLTSTVTVALLTSTALDAPLIRVPVEPSERNGLRKRSYAMIDQIFSAGTRCFGQVFGHLDDADMLAVNRALVLFVGSLPDRDRIAVSGRVTAWPALAFPRANHEAGHETQAIEPLGNAMTTSTDTASSTRRKVHVDTLETLAAQVGEFEFAITRKASELTRFRNRTDTRRSGPGNGRESNGHEGNAHERKAHHGRRNRRSPSP